MAKTPSTSTARPRKARADAAPPPPSTPLSVVQTPPAKAPAGKLGALVALLQRSQGATIAALSEATGWQVHSVRGAISGALKKKYGLTVVSEKTEAGRVYRIPAATPASDAEAQA